MRKQFCKISDREILQASLLTDKPRKVKFTPAYSGGKILANGVGIPEPLTVDGAVYAPGTPIPTVVNLDTLVVRNQNIPILYNHSAENRIGHTVQIANNGREITGEGLIDTPSRWKSEIVESFKNGARWQSSIGSGRIDPTQKTLIRPGETRMVNGREHIGPFILLDRLELLEISIVPAGADPATDVLLASLTRSHNMDFESFCASKGFDASTLDEANLNALHALYDEVNQLHDTLKASVDANQDKNQKEPAEPADNQPKEPAADSDPDPDPDADPADEPDDEPDKLQASADPTPRGAARVFPSLNVPRAQTAPAAEVPTRSEVLQASALLNLGIPAEWLASRKGGEFSKRCVDMADRERDTSILSIMGEVLQASGTRPDYRRPYSIVSQYKETLQASGVSTKQFGDLNVFSPVLDKQMRYKYEMLDSVWKRLYKKRVVPNFNAVATVDISIEGNAKDLLENEDFPVVMFKSSGQELRTKKQGITAGISFESQINDDMGALNEVGDELLKIIVNMQTRKFWTYFWTWAGTTFTNASHNKIKKALSIDGLSAARKAFRSMKDSNGNFIQCLPMNLIVPLALEDKALEIFHSEWAGEATTRKNIYQHKYDVISDPYLGTDGGMTGATDTGWFLAGDTGAYPIGEYAVLSGFETPKIMKTWYDDKDALMYRALGTIGFTGYTDKLAIVYSDGTQA